MSVTDIPESVDFSGRSHAPAWQDEGTTIKFTRSGNYSSPRVAPLDVRTDSPQVVSVNGETRSPRSNGSNQQFDIRQTPVSPSATSTEKKSMTMESTVTIPLDDHVFQSGKYRKEGICLECGKSEAAHAAQPPRVKEAESKALAPFSERKASSGVLPMIEKKEVEVGSPSTSAALAFAGPNSSPPSARRSKDHNSTEDELWKKLVKQLKQSTEDRTDDWCEGHPPLTTLAEMSSRVSVDLRVLGSHPFDCFKAVLNLTRDDRSMVGFPGGSMWHICELLLKSALALHVQCRTEQIQLFHQHRADMTEHLETLLRRLENPDIKSLAGVRQRCVFSVTIAQAVVQLFSDDAPEKSNLKHAMNVLQTATSFFGFGESQLGVIVSDMMDFVHSWASHKFISSWLSQVVQLWFERDAWARGQIGKVVHGSSAIKDSFSGQIHRVQKSYGTLLRKVKGVCIWQPAVTYLELHHKYLEMVAGVDKNLANLPEGEKDKLNEYLLHGFASGESDGGRLPALLDGVDFSRWFVLRDHVVREKVISIALDIVLTASNSSSSSPSSSLSSTASPPLQYSPIVIQTMQGILLERRLREEHQVVLETLRSREQVAAIKTAYQEAFGRYKDQLKKLVDSKHTEAVALTNTAKRDDPNATNALTRHQREAMHFAAALQSLRAEVRADDKNQLDLLVSTVKQTEQLVMEKLDHIAAEVKAIRSQLNRIEDKISVPSRLGSSIIVKIDKKPNHYVLRPAKLRQLQERIEGPGHVAAICGIAGSGKTELAKHFAEEWLNSVGGLTQSGSASKSILAWWFNASSPSELLKSFTGLLEEFHIHFALKRDESETAAIKRSKNDLQAELLKGDWNILFIFDNTLSFDYVRPYFLERIGVVERCWTVLTGWSSQILSSLSSSLEPVDLNGGLEFDQAEQLLLNTAGIKTKYTVDSAVYRSMRNLLFQLDYLPLAILNAGKVISGLAGEIKIGHHRGSYSIVSSNTIPPSPPRKHSVADADSSLIAGAGDQERRHSVSDPFASFLKSLQQFNASKLASAGFIDAVNPHDPQQHQEGPKYQSASIHLALSRTQSVNPLFRKLLDFTALMDSQNIPAAVLWELWRAMVCRVEASLSSQVKNNFTLCWCCPKKAKTDRELRTQFNEMIQSQHNYSLLCRRNGNETFYIHRTVQLQLRLIAQRHEQGWRDKRLNRLLDALEAIHPVLRLPSVSGRFECTTQSLMPLREVDGSIKSRSTQASKDELKSILGLKEWLPHLHTIVRLPYSNHPSPDLFERLLRVRFRTLAYLRESSDYELYRHYAYEGYSLFLPSGSKLPYAEVIGLQNREQWEFAFWLRLNEAMIYAYQEKLAMNYFDQKFFPTIEAKLTRFIGALEDGALVSVPRDPSDEEKWALHIRCRGGILRAIAVHRLGTEDASALSSAESAAKWCNVLAAVTGSSSEILEIADAKVVMAMAFLALDKCTEAVAEGEAAIAMIKLQDGDDSARLLQAHIIVAEAYLQRTSSSDNPPESDPKFDAAQKHVQASLHMTQRVFGENSAAFASVQHCQGLLLKHQGKYAQAAAAFRKAADLREKLSIGSQANTGESWLLLSECLMEMKEYDEAHTRVLRASTLFQRAYGRNAPQEHRLGIRAFQLTVKSNKAIDEQNQRADQVEAKIQE